jgi:hypothetical protein
MRSIWGSRALADDRNVVVSGKMSRQRRRIPCAGALAQHGVSPMSNRAVGLQIQELLGMCDYSLQSTMSRPAKVGDKLTTHDFGTGTRGFAAAEDAAVAVCVLPGTELAFSSAVTVIADLRFFASWEVRTLGHATAIFRQVNKNEPWKHHDALEFPDGHIVLLTQLCEGQEATVLQLPVQPTTAAEEEAQKRAAYAR